MFQYIIITPQSRIITCNRYFYEVFLIKAARNARRTWARARQRPAANARRTYAAGADRYPALDFSELCCSCFFYFFALTFTSLP